ncbi:MAG TPA: UBP-type zinc finger domain-containing protein [Acidimicrobiales bacterium]|nr:UBP-type zinc finger domain-containing protein [Acidimicrobiales bacterium]
MTCTHLDQIRDVTPSTRRCEACVEAGSTWVHLRMCLTCATVACCDSSPLRHATAHHHETGHPIVRSVEPGEAWRWCYPDQELV